MIFPNGDVYNGEYDEDGLMSGSGVIKYANGDMYSGDFSQGLMHGAGKMNYANGAVYIGEFHDDLLDGEGEYRFPSHTQMYKGQFREGLMHGQGILMELDKTESKFGWWQDGEFVGPDPPLEEIKPH